MSTRIPRGSILATSGAAPAIKGLTDLDGAYKVAMSATAVRTYETKHRPKGAHLESSGSNCNDGKSALIMVMSIPVAGTHEYSATLTIGIAALSAHSTLLRLDAQVSWVASRPGSEKAQVDASLELTVYRSNQFGGNVTVGLSGTQQQEVTKRLNSLPLAATAQCAQSDPLYQLQYDSPSSSLQATGYACAGTVLVTADGKPAAPLNDRSLSLVGLMNQFLPSAEAIGTTNSAGGWAGWVSVSPPGTSKYQTVSATWTVPNVSCDPFEMSSAVEWVGIDGFGESTVQQTGTESQCIVGTGTYAAWWELFGTPISGGVQVDLPGDDHINPGDVVFAQVVAGQGSGGPGIGGPAAPGSGSYLFDWVNFTEHWSWWAIEGPVGTLPQLTAEWIVEQNSCFWVCQALAKYGSETFGQMSLSLNTLAYPFGTIAPPSTFPGFSVNLVTDGTLKETGSSLTGSGNTELVTWVHR